MQRFAFGPANGDEREGGNDEIGNEQAGSQGRGDHNGTRSNDGDIGTDSNARQSARPVFFDRWALEESSPLGSIA